LHGTAMERTTLQVETCEYTVLVDEIHAHDAVQREANPRQQRRSTLNTVVTSTCLQDE
jgi:hypothetical protein